MSPSSNPDPDPGPRDAFERAARRAVDRFGRQVTIETPVIETDANDDPVFDDQGDPVLDTSDGATETLTVAGETVQRGSVQFERRFAGAEVDIDAIILIPERSVIDDDGDALVTLTAGEDDVTSFASEIVVPESGRYRVTHIDRQRDGLYRCACIRIGTD